MFKMMHIDIGNYTAMIISILRPENQKEGSATKKAKTQRPKARKRVETAKGTKRQKTQVKKEVSNQENGELVLLNRFINDKRKDF